MHLILFLSWYIVEDICELASTGEPVVLTYEFSRYHMWPAPVVACMLLSLAASFGRHPMLGCSVYRIFGQGHK